MSRQDAKPTPKPEPKPTRGLKAVGAISDRLTKPILGKRGLAEGELIRHWPMIVGPALAAVSQPEKVWFPRDRRDGGELTVRVGNGAIATMLQHQAAQIIERVNRFYSYAALNKLKIIQAPLPPRRTAKGPEMRPLSAEEDAELQQTVAKIADPELRDALLALGRSMRARQKRP